MLRPGEVWRGEGDAHDGPVRDGDLGDPRRADRRPLRLPCGGGPDRPCGSREDPRRGTRLHARRARRAPRHRLAPEELRESTMSDASVLSLILFAVAVVLVVAGVAVYNRLVTLRNRYRNAFAQIDVQLKRRYD